VAKSTEAQVLHRQRSLTTILRAFGIIEQNKLYKLVCKIRFAFLIETISNAVPVNPFDFSSYLKKS
jgi:hypothetical protein